MSDYEDDYEDGDADFFYVEDEYMAADDLAEHAVASPPPATCGDEDMEEDWDRFDYFNDLEYASDGYDDTRFQALDVKGAKAGIKRKRVGGGRSGKKRVAQEGDTTAHTETTAPGHSPIVWRSQADRGLKPKMLDDNAQPYALFKDWREKLTQTPEWAKGSPPNSPGAPSLPAEKEKGKMAFVTEPVSPPYDEEEEEEEGDEEDMGDEGHGISQEALLAALQRQLAAAGGPLSGMDPQQLLEFATRMAANKDAGDDIAGEMADAMFEGEDEEDDTEAEEKLLSWVAKQRNSNKETADDESTPADAAPSTKQPPTPPSSSHNHSTATSQTSTTTDSKTTKPSRKRKADNEPASEGPAKAAKKRNTRSFDAPTASSQAKAAPAKPTTRSRTTRRG